MNKKRLSTLFLASMVSITLASCGNDSEEESLETDEEVTEETETETETETESDIEGEGSEADSEDSESEEVAEEPEEVTVRLSFAGDIMGHGQQIESAYNAETGEYNYESVFEYVRPHFEDSDLAFANLEVVLAGPDYAYTGYPLFNSPDALLDGLEYAGFTMLNTTNNHSFDLGVDGLVRTRNVIDESNLTALGTYTERPDSRVHYETFADKTFAFLTYAENFNGLVDPVAERDFVSQYANFIDEEFILADIQETKDNEADVIIVNMHWGFEYQHEPNPYQTEFMELLVENGVDIVMGGHPHVVQPAEILEVGDHEAFVVYSLGNFVSNQRIETLGELLGETARATEDGVIVHTDITIKGDEIHLTNVEIMPTWVYRIWNEATATFDYHVLPTEDFIENPDFAAPYVDRIEASRDRTLSILGNRGLFEEEIDIELGDY